MNEMIKKPILLGDIAYATVIDKMIIESLEQALYRVVIEIKGQQYYVLESEGKSLTRHSVVAIQEQFKACIIKQIFLQHSSPYDEMIGLEVNATGNTLLVPIGNYFETVEQIH